MSLDVDRVLAQADAIIAGFRFPDAIPPTPPPLIPPTFTYEGVFRPPPPMPSPVRVPPQSPHQLGDRHWQYASPPRQREGDMPWQYASSPASDALEWALRTFSKRRVHAPVSPSQRMEGRRAPSRSSFPTPESSIPRPPHWSLDDFELGRKLGEGRFGKIYLARERGTKCAVAIKCISKDVVAKHSLEEQIRREVDVHGSLHTRLIGESTLSDEDDPTEGLSGATNVLRLLAYFWDASVVYLIEEFANGGDLSGLLAAQPVGRFSEDHAREILRGLCRAVGYLHSRHILHRDIKAENVLLKSKKLLRRGGALPDGAFQYDVKLSDFTWAVQLPPTLRREDRRTTLCGTLDYLAPEVVLQQPYDYGADTWGLGVLAYELLFGSPPFEHEDPAETCRRIVRCDIEFPSEVRVSPEAKEFIKSLLVPDPRGRLTAAQALYHPWLSLSEWAPPDPSVAESPNPHHTVGDFTPYRSSVIQQPPEVSATTATEEHPSHSNNDTTVKGHWTTYPNTTEGSAAQSDASAVNFSLTLKPGVQAAHKTNAPDVVEVSAWTPNLSEIGGGGGMLAAEGVGGVAAEGSTPPSPNASYVYVHRVLDMGEESPVKDGNVSNDESEIMGSSLADSIQGGLESSSNSYRGE